MFEDYVLPNLGSTLLWKPCFVDINSMKSPSLEHLTFDTTGQQTKQPKTNYDAEACVY